MKEKLFQLKLNRIKKRGERYKKEYELKEAYVQYVPERKKRKVSNVMLVVVVVAVVGYVAANFILQYHTGQSMDSSITIAWFSFFTAEILSLTGIKLSKVKNNYGDKPCGEFDSISAEIDKLESEETYD